MAMEVPSNLKGKLVWIVLILIVSGWMFVLGIMVGRGTAPMPQINQSIEQKLAELKAPPVDQTPEKPNPPADQEESIPVTELKFYEELKETKPAPTPKLPAPKPLKPVTPVPTEPPPVKSAPAPRAEIKPAPKTQAPPKDQKPVPAVKKTTPEPSQSGHFTIQVAAVKNIGGAVKLVELLRGEGFDAYQMSSKSENGETWYRVRVGAFKDRSEAQPTLSRLSKMNFNGMVMQTP